MKFTLETESDNKLSSQNLYIQYYAGQKTQKQAEINQALLARSTKKDKASFNFIALCEHQVFVKHHETILLMSMRVQNYWKESNLENVELLDKQNTKKSREHLEASYSCHTSLNILVV